MIRPDPRMDTGWLWRYRWPSLKAELKKWTEARTGHEDAVPLHFQDQKPSRAVPAEPRLSGIEKQQYEEVVLEREREAK